MESNSTKAGQASRKTGKRKRPRLTMPPKKKSTTIAEPDAMYPENEGKPSPEDFELYTPLRVFKVYDSVSSRDVQFSLGDVALVVPHFKQPKVRTPAHELWVAKILEVRMGHDETDIWVLVEWFWSAKDISDQFPNAIDVTKCPKYERIASPHKDILHSTTFDGIVKMKYYLEDDLSPTPIRSNDFFCRFAMDKRGRLEPKPRNSCVCGVVYNPDEDTMHVCPICRKAYHDRCLNACSSVGFIDGRQQKMEIFVDDSDDSASSSESGEIPSPDQNSDIVYSGIPEEILIIARSSIVKGKNGGGLIGNIAAVVQARKIVRRVLHCGGTVPERWRVQLKVDAGWVEWCDNMRKRNVRYEYSPFLCPNPNCGGPI